MKKSASKQRVGKDGKEELIVCPLEDVIAVFGGKWKSSILWHLEEGPRRFNELKRLFPAISQRMLTKQLRSLVRDGLVHREHYPEIPPRVVYSLTELGKSLEPIFIAMGQWGDQHMATVEKARSLSEVPQS